MKRLLLVVAWASLAGAAWADIDFAIRHPTAAQISAAYPPAAKKASIAGQVLFRCAVEAMGAPKDCALLRENPTGMGFEAAARKLLPEYRFSDVKGAATSMRREVVDVEFKPKGFQDSKWLHVPTEAEVDAVRPAGADRLGRQGDVSLVCSLAPDSVLSDCHAYASNQDAALEAAAMKLAPLFRLQPASQGGGAVGTVEEITIPWDLPLFDTAPGWLRRPSAEQILKIWPEAAIKRGIGGDATVECIVNTLGVLTNCKVNAESPEGLGFGSAALTLTPQFLMKPALNAGHPVSAMVRVPVVFVGPISGVDVGPPLLAYVSWVAAPTYADVAAAYPGPARAAGLSGRASLKCRITNRLQLTACESESEEPRGAGFANAARQLAAKFVAPEKHGESFATRGASVHLPFSFTPAALLAEPRANSAKLLSTPPGEAFAAALPKGDPSTAVEALLDCRVGAGGKPEDCRVLSETPAGKGYGAAMAKLAETFVVTIWTEDGLPTIGGRLRIPLRYEFK